MWFWPDKGSRTGSFPSACIGVLPWLSASGTGEKLLLSSMRALILANQHRPKDCQYSFHFLRVAVGQQMILLQNVRSVCPPPLGKGGV